MKKQLEKQEQEYLDKKLKEIGIKIRQLRSSENSNYEAWAYLNGVNKVSLSRLERGENVTMKLLITILQKLDVSLEKFFKHL